MAALSSEDHAITKAADHFPFSLPFDLDEVLCQTVHHSSGHSLEASPRSSPNWRSIVMAFPAVTVSHGGGGTTRCSVCMEGFRGSGDSGRRIPCGHVYHADCITTWLSLDDSCPLCRLKISPEKNES